MRVVAALAVLAASCRFDPSGGAPPPSDDDVVADAGLDGTPADGEPVADAAIDAAPACPADYVQHGAHRFAYRATATTFALARQDCNDDAPGRTHLATFENPADLDPVISAIDPGNNTTPWVGAVCPSPLDCDLSVSWFWVTQVPVAPGEWFDGQPDNGDTETVARAERLRGTWQLTNVAPSLSLPYLCECEP
jgi:hypothetical protein